MDHSKIYHGGWIVGPFSALAKEEGEEDHSKLFHGGGIGGPLSVFAIVEGLVDIQKQRGGRKGTEG